MRSVRRYLVSRVLLGTAAVLALAGTIVYVAVARSLERQLDVNLADRVQALASILFQTRDELSFEFSDELMPEYDVGEHPAYFELRLTSGLLVERSNSLGEDGELALRIEPGPEVACWSAPLPDGRAGRYAVQRVEVHHVFPEEGPARPQAASVVIAVARGTESLRATKRAVLLQVLTAFALLVVLVGLLTRIAVRSGLEPSRRLARALDTVSMEALPESLDVGELPEELEPMARKTDALLRRVAQALERERRTTADIAHELRTPISEVLTVSEVALRHNGHGTEEGGALSTIRDIASHMGRSVSTLLKLAWLESGADPPARSEVDLVEIVAEVRRALGGAARERDLEILEQMPARLQVESDPDVLRIVVSNLLSNAFTYAPPAGEVRLGLEGSGGAWCFSVSNRTDELRPEDLAVLSDPFWRKDRARGDRKRFGLGLALSSALAERTGLRLEFDLADGVFRALLRGEAPAFDARSRSGLA